MKTLTNDQLTAANKLLLMKAVSNYDFYYDFSEMMEDTNDEDQIVEMFWYFDVKTNKIILETQLENTWAEYEHGYDNRYCLYGTKFGKDYDVDLHIAFFSIIDDFHDFVLQGNFGTMVWNSEKDAVNLNLVSWILNKIIK